MRVQYEDVNNGPGVSPKIFHDAKIQEMLMDNGVGFVFKEEFLNSPEFDSATSQSGFITYQDSGVTIKGLATEVGGVIQIAGADADNDEGSITTGAGHAGMVKIASSAGKKLWMEARVRASSIADQALFVGLAEEGAAVADVLADDSGALAAGKDFVGFRTLTATPTQIDAIYQKASQAISTADSTKDLAAATWIKLGLKYNPSEGTLQYFVDGELVRTVSDVSISTFPDGEELAPLIALKTGEAVEKKLDIDWIWVAQER